MSQENVEIVRRFIDVYNRRDFEGIIELMDRLSNSGPASWDSSPSIAHPKVSHIATSRCSTRPTITLRSS